MKRTTRWTVTAMVVCLLVVPAVNSQGGNPKLEGTWELVKIQFGDKETKPPPDTKPAIWTFKGDTISAKNFSKLAEVGNYSVDDSKKPQELNFTKFGKNPDILAIYTLEGNILKVGMKGTGMGRPMAFDAKDTLVITLRKIM